MTFITQGEPLTQTWAKRLRFQLADTIAAMVRGYINRRAATASLGNLSEAHLRDIGLTRNDVATLDFDLPSNGALELANIAKSRAGNW